MAEVAADDGTVSAKERTGWVFRNARILLLALILLIVAAVLVGVSFAVFSTSSANAGNMFTAGTLMSTTDNDGAAILTATRMVPGDTAEGTVGVTNTGDSKGAFTLTSSGLTDDPGDNGGELSSVLELTVVMDGDTANPVYEGPLDIADPVALGDWDGGVSHEFVFTVTFPDTGLPTGPTEGDNAYQGSSTSVTYNWNATSVSSS